MIAEDMYQGELVVTDIPTLLVFIIDLHPAAGDHEAFSVLSSATTLGAYSGGTLWATSGAVDVAEEDSGPGRALEVLAVDEEQLKPLELSTYHVGKLRRVVCRQTQDSTMKTSKPKLATRKIFFLHLASFETYTYGDRKR